MPIYVSDMANYTNYVRVPIGSEVDLISEEFVKFNGRELKYEVNDTDVDKFRKAILLNRESISYRGGKNNIMRGGYGGIVEYTVKFLDTNEEETFRSSPPKYYFKTINKPTSGGKRKTKKNRKTNRKSTRKH